MSHNVDYFILFSVSEATTMTSRISRKLAVKKPRDEC